MHYISCVWSSRFKRSVSHMRAPSAAPKEREREREGQTRQQITQGAGVCLRIIKWSLFLKVCASNKNSAGLIRPASNTTISHAAARKTEKSRRRLLPLAWNPVGIKIDQNPSAICWALWWIFQRETVFEEKESTPRRGALHNWAAWFNWEFLFLNQHCPTKALASIWYLFSSAACTLFFLKAQRSKGFSRVP